MVMFAIISLYKKTCSYILYLKLYSLIFKLCNLTYLYTNNYVLKVTRISCLCVFVFSCPCNVIMRSVCSMSNKLMFCSVLFHTSFKLSDTYYLPV